MVSLGVALFCISMIVPLLSFLFTGAAFTTAIDNRAFENELERIEQQGLLAPVVKLHQPETPAIKKAA